MMATSSASTAGRLVLQILLVFVVVCVADAAQLHLPVLHRIQNNATVFLATTEATTVSNAFNTTPAAAVAPESSANVTASPTQVAPLVAQVTEPDRGIFENILGFFGINQGSLPSLPSFQPQPQPPAPQQPPAPVAFDPQKCPRCKCGLTYLGIRIVGGQETKVNEYPWMTILKYSGRFYCGASIINNYYLVTAAHCVNGFQKERLSAMFLEHDQKNPNQTPTYERKIDKILRHRYYNTGGTYNNDIALLKLDKPLNFDDGRTMPVCLPPLGKSFTSLQGIVIGWGATQESGAVATKLQEVEVPIMSNDNCKKTGYDAYKITENMMCAGYPEGKKDSCQGDSGGPMHVRNGSIHQIVGIVSWGEGCAEPNYPGVYTRVNRYITWIKSNTKDACYCSD